VRVGNSCSGSTWGIVSVVQDSDFAGTTIVYLPREWTLSLGHGCAERSRGERSRMDAPSRGSRDGSPTGRLVGATQLSGNVPLAPERKTSARWINNRPFLASQTYGAEGCGSDNDSAGCDWIWIVSDTYEGQKGRGLRAKLWNPFLKKMGGSSIRARSQGNYRRPSVADGLMRSFCLRRTTQTVFREGGMRGFTNCANLGTPHSSSGQSSYATWRRRKAFDRRIVETSPWMRSSGRPKNMRDC